ncbi:MAG TPA: hypothetical protein VGR01_15100 [Burkholderiales bacterium]|jgi:hypothetical protein|nr:hypothetical protein [Burkholderiales bacterium]
MSRAKLGAVPATSPVRTVTLFVPSLFWPDTGDTDSYSGLRLPALEMLLSRGSAADSSCENEPAWLCERFGVQKQTDWPVAPVAYAGDGGEPGAAYWLRADPVHLRLHNDGLILLAPETLEIAEDESYELTGVLNRQFEAEGIVFHAPHPRRWYLKMPQAPQIRTVTLKQTVGRDVNRLLPEGEQRLRWHRIFNEVQMLLHAHPVNTTREDRGLAVVNSLWFWGGGTLPAVASTFDATQGDDPLAVGLARLAGINSAPLPGGGALAAGNNTLVDLRDAEREFMRGNVAGWRHALETLETRWFAPIFDWLRRGRIGKVVIATVADGHRHEWSVMRGARWQVWKRPRLLAHHAREVLHRYDSARLA